MSFRMKRPKKAAPAPSKAAPGPSFGALGVLHPDKAGLVSGEPNGLRDISSALGNQAMGTLLSGVVKGAGDTEGALPLGVEGPVPLPKVDVPATQTGKSKPKELLSEEWFHGVFDPFLDRLLLPIVKDPQRRAFAAEQLRNAVKSFGQGWLDKGLDGSGLEDMEKEEVKRRYEQAADKEVVTPP